MYVDEFEPSDSGRPEGMPTRLRVVGPDGQLAEKWATLRDGFYFFEVEDDDLRTKLELDLAEADIEWSNSSPTSAFRIKIRLRPMAAEG